MLFSDAPYYLPTGLFNSFGKPMSNYRGTTCLAPVLLRSPIPALRLHSVLLRFLHKKLCWHISLLCTLIALLCWHNSLLRFPTTWLRWHSIVWCFPISSLCLLIFLSCSPIILSSTAMAVFINQTNFLTIKF
jgi:hypothetical protein